MEFLWSPKAHGARDINIPKIVVNCRKMVFKKKENKQLFQTITKAYALLIRKERNGTLDFNNKLNNNPF